MGPRYLTGSAISGSAAVEQLTFFLAQGRADTGQILTRVGFCLVPARRCRSLTTMVADLVEKSVDGAKSANIELCVICRFSLETKIKDRTNLCPLTSGDRLRMVRFCRPRSGVRRKL